MARGDDSSVEEYTIGVPSLAKTADVLENWKPPCMSLTDLRSVVVSRMDAEGESPDRNAYIELSLTQIITFAFFKTGTPERGDSDLGDVCLDVYEVTLPSTWYTVVTPSFE